MTYYNSNGEKREYTNLKPFDSGDCGQLFSYDNDKLLKIYFERTHKDNRIKQYVYEVAKEMNNSHLINISELLYNEKPNDLDTQIVQAYTCEYIKKDDVDILTTPTEYLLENIHELDKIFKYFTSKKIVVDDVKPANTILQKDKIVLIDIDCFRKVSYEDYILSYINEQTIPTLLEGIFLECYAKHNIQNIKEASKFEIAIHDLFWYINSLPEENRIKTIDELFKKYKYPVDAIKVYQKNRVIDYNTFKVHTK